MKIVCVEITSTFGSFTTSDSNAGLFFTHKFPTKTAVTGMVGAILGLSFEETVEYLMGDLKVAVEPNGLPEVVKHKFFNHHRWDRDRTANIAQEMLVDPSYRIFLKFDEVTDEKIVDATKLGIGEGKFEIYTAFKKSVEESRSYYPLYMGRNNFPLEYSKRDITLEGPNGTDEALCESLVPFKAVNENFSFSYDIRFKEGKKLPMGVTGYQIFKNIPVDESVKRQYKETIDLLYKKNEKFQQRIDLTSVNPDYETFIYEENGTEIVVFFF